MLLAILAFIIILGAAVIIHEFGHFIVAKMLGIRVETFSVGFGKRLFGKRWGTTDYRVSLIPLGGYVKLGGDESNAGLEEGSGESDIPTKERFDLRPRWHKLLVAVAGPVMNILTALAIPLVTAMTSGAPVMPAPVVKNIAPGGAAEAAGVLPGDRIISFNGRDNSEWEKIQNDAMLNPERPLPLVVERAGQRVPLTISPSKHVMEGEVFGMLDILPDYGDVPVILKAVIQGSPANEAGLMPGDQILTIGGEAIHSGEQVVRYIEEHKTGAIAFGIKRGAETLQIMAGERRLPNGKLGITPAELAPLEKLGLADAASYAVAHNVEMLRVTGVALSQVFVGDRSVRDTVSGPIGIAVASKRFVEEEGFGGGIRMLGFLSLNLGVFNLLPIPVLDGGMIFMLLLEGLLALVGKTLSMRVRERIQYVGFVFLLLLMSLVIINDVTKVASRFVGSGDQPATQQK